MTSTASNLIEYQLERFIYTDTE